MSDLSSLPRPWQANVLSLLRFVAGLLFLQHGLMKLFGFPAPYNGHLAGLVLLASLIETIGGVLVCVGLLTRPAAFIMSGEMAVRVLHVTRSQIRLPDRERRRPGNHVLLRLPVSCGCRGWRLEPGSFDRRTPLLAGRTAGRPRDRVTRQLRHCAGATSASAAIRPSPGICRRLRGSPIQRTRTGLAGPHRGVARWTAGVLGG